VYVHKVLLYTGTTGTLRRRSFSRDLHAVEIYRKNADMPRLPLLVLQHSAKTRSSLSNVVIVAITKTVLLNMSFQRPPPPNNQFRPPPPAPGGSGFAAPPPGGPRPGAGFAPPPPNAGTRPGAGFAPPPPAPGGMNQLNQGMGNMSFQSRPPGPGAPPAG
jgi:hypothetical protein